METFILLVFLGIIATSMLGLGVLGIYVLVREYARKKREAEERQARAREERRKAALAFLNSNRERLQSAIEEFAHYTDERTGYFANFRLATWKALHASLFVAVQDNWLGELGLDPPTQNILALFRTTYANAESLRSAFNHAYVENELKRYAHYFDECIEGKSLDLQQRTSIVTDEDNNLVIAGAGTGKTTTILGKVAYIVERYAVNPQEILLISFTRKFASDLAARITIPGIEVKTFHKFGLDVIKAVEDRPPSIFEEEQFQPLLVRFFKDLMEEPSYLARVTAYFSEFLKRPRSPFEF